MLETADKAADGAPRKRRTAVFFVASPLHYLAARRIAADHEGEARNLLVWYDKHLESMVLADSRHVTQPWDASLYMPWPRFEPLPGFAGRHRQLLSNVKMLAKWVGQCDELILHSPVYDTEAINYLLHALRRSSQARTFCARILPDGLLNMRRYPLSASKRFLQQARRLRSIASPSLRYTTFAGDRIGSEAEFTDRIYVLNGFPHDYPATKVVELEPLVSPTIPKSGISSRIALVVGQPLTEFNLMEEPTRADISKRISAWLYQQQVVRVQYKAHPKEAHKRGLLETHYEPLTTDEPLEIWMAANPCGVVVGCFSTALITARQIYGANTTVAAFGVEKVRFRGGNQQRDDMISLMKSLNIELH